jgi:hypothetical protein
MDVRALALTLLATTVLCAADEQQLALILKAQKDFDRVDLNAAPQLPDTSACVLSQAALLPVASKTDLPLVYFRKSWCSLAGATITGNAALYSDAVSGFQKGIDAWPGRVAMQPKKTAPEPLPPPMPVMAAISRLLASPGDAAVTKAAQQQLTAALTSPTCFALTMSIPSCQADLNLGREWLGWIALSSDKLADAARYFASASDSGWPAWVAGRQAFQAAKYSEAAAQYRSAIAVWQQKHTDLAGPLGKFAPPTDLGLALTDLGGAQLLAGDTAGAIGTLDLAVKTDAAHSRTFYYRARAKEVAGRGAEALTDYSLASRTAFASTVDLASGEAHLYRGIADFRRKNFTRAEDEFASALNFEIPAAMRNDAVAWRHMAAVAAGNCAAAREQLSRALGTVSPFFPKNEATAMIGGCPSASAAK